MIARCSTRPKRLRLASLHTPRSIRGTRLALTAALSVMLLAAAPLHASSVDEPRWELGAGLGGASLADYRGSDQATEYVVPIPYVRYIAPRVRIDREGGRYYFLRTRDLQLDLSAAFAPPVDSDTNQARQGMPDLEPILELGPRLQIRLWESENRNFLARFALPVRAGVATDLRSAEGIGVVLSPYFQLRYFGHWESAISVGPIWASKQYHRYFYRVTPEYATAERPAYDPGGGYSGARVTVSTSRRHRKWWWGVFARYDDLTGAVFSDSPLVKQDYGLYLGFGIAWVFMSSPDAAPVPEND